MLDEFKNLCEVLGITTEEAEQNSLTTEHLKDIISIRVLIEKLN